MISLSAALEDLQIHDDLTCHQRVGYTDDVDSTSAKQNKGYLYLLRGAATKINDFRVQPQSCIDRLAVHSSSGGR